MTGRLQQDTVVCVVGLGYVGYPLAKLLSKHFDVIGYDVSQKKVESMKDENFTATQDPAVIGKADYILVCVPTPVARSKNPDLSYIESSSKTVGKYMKEGAVVVYETTVYPGVTEEFAVPILESASGMECGKDFYVGYSPERVNPGDAEHDVDGIVKVVSGMNEDITERLAELYGKITEVHKAENIKTAEAAKVIENVQRDLNIALMNELSMIFDKMGLDTSAVLDAAATKWNFHRYSPGLVGGHCIPVDPYYLVYKAKELGYHPQVILAGRAINDNMPKHVAEMAIKGINSVGKVIKGSTLLVMGLTYKENVPDTRESPAREMIEAFKEYGVNVYGHDPLLSKDQIEGFGVKAVESIDDIKADCVVITVAHDEYRRMKAEDLVDKVMKESPVLVDVRRVFKKEELESMGVNYITL